MKTIPVMLDGKKSKIGGANFILLGMLYTFGTIFPEAVAMYPEIFAGLERAFVTTGMGFGIWGVAGKLQKQIDR
jgi:hypothetical protein